MAALSRPARLGNRWFALRHGESEANAGGLIASDPERAEAYGLTPRGRAQVAASIAEAPLRAGRLVVLCSPLRRARESAELLRARFGAALAIAIEPAFRERGFGALDGGSDAAYGGVWAADALDPSQARDGVEPACVVCERAAARVLEEEARLDDHDVLIVAHGDVIQVLWTWFAGLPASAHREREAVAPGGIVRLDVR